jgi:amino acid permease
MEQEKALLKTPLIFKRMSLDEDYFMYGCEVKKLSPMQAWREIYLRPITNGSLRASILCLLSVTLGSSFLSLPYLMKTQGIVLCLLLFFFSAFACHWTLSLLAQVSIKEGSFEYSDMMAKYYSNNMVIFTNVMVLICNIGSVLAWNKFMSNILSNLMEYMNMPEMFGDREYTKILISMLVVLFVQVPICTFNVFARFHVLSIIGSFMIIYIILVSIFEWPIFFEQNFSWNRLSFFNLNVSSVDTLCILFFSFGNHSTILNAMSELDPNNEKRIKILVNYTSFSESFLYLVTMLVGYFSTYDLTNEIYINRTYQSIFMIIGKFLLIGLMICNVGLYYYMIKPYFDFRKEKDKNHFKLEDEPFNIR